jgi:hypothetical protein
LETGEPEASQPRNLPAWMRVTALLLLVISGALALWLYASDSNRTRSGDMAAVREVSIVASNFRSWPETAHQIARTNLFHQGINGTVGLYHPEIGRFAVTYSTTAPPAPATPGRPAVAADEGGTTGGIGAAACVPSATSRCIDIVDGRMTVRGVALDGPRGPGDRYHARAVAQQRVLPAGTSLIYYAIRDLPLEAVLTLPAGFDHVLIVEGASATIGKELPALKVVTQIGRPEIPVRSLNELPRLRDQTATLAEAAAKMDSTGSAAGLVSAIGADRPDALVPVDSRIAGKAYRLYLYPVSIAATDRTIDFYVVGIAPARSSLFDVDLTGAAAIAFALALAILLALTPVIKLAFLGPVDGIRRLELTGIVAGLVLAAGLSTAALVLAWDVLSARQAAHSAMVAQSARLAGAMHLELKSQLQRPMHPLLAGMVPDPLLATRPDSIIIGAADRTTDLPQPNTFFFLDGVGRQALDTPIIARRDQPGADFDVGDRGYYRRALIGELDPGSGELDAAALKGCRDFRGFAIEQVRSRPDGVAKTVVAVPLLAASLDAYVETARPADPGQGSAVQDRCAATVAQLDGEGRVLVLSFVMQAMLGPRTEAGSDYAVVDLGEQDWPVLFHSQRGRAHIEYMESGLDAGTRRSIGATATDAPMAGACKAGTIRTERLVGIYEGTERLIAVARVPCTRWAVLSFANRDAVDRAAARAALNAMILWLGLAFLVSIAVGAATLLRTALKLRSWDWLWPDESRRLRYARLWPIGGAAALAILLFALVKPEWGLVAMLLAVAAAGGLLWQMALPADAVREPLSEATEAHFRKLMLVLLLLVSVVPVVGLAADARSHFRAVADVAQSEADLAADARADRESASIRRVFRLAWRDRPFPAAQDGGAAIPSVELPPSFTAIARRIAVGDDSLVPVAAPGSSLSARPGEVGLVVLLCFLGLLAGLVAAAVRTVGRSLFGFGIALEAVDYPRFEEPGGLLDLKAVRPCFMAIGAPSRVRSQLLEAADKKYDLYQVTAPNWDLAAVKLPEPHAKQPLLMLYDFELLFRDTNRRQSALQLIERLLEEQRAQPAATRCRIGLLADLSPLDRFLQSSEHRESAGAVDVQSRWTNAEDIRWSRILEQFTNYVYRAARRDEAGVTVAPEDRSTRLVLDELAYLPDHVVEAIIPDTSAGLQSQEIVDWAQRKHLDGQTEAAIIDFLASQLIEHYHYLWSISSRAEQILIYRFAHGQLVNIAEAYALRSLVRRGIVVLDPVPRIMNRSFAQFVRHVEEPKRLRIWQQSQPDGLWTRLRAPLTLVVPLLLAFFALLLIEGANSIVSTVPLLLAAGPAVLNIIGGFRRSFG